MESTSDKSEEKATPSAGEVGRREGADDGDLFTVDGDLGGTLEPVLRQPAHEPAANLLVAHELMITPLRRITKAVRSGLTGSERTGELHAHVAEPAQPDLRDLRLVGSDGQEVAYVVDRVVRDRAAARQPWPGEPARTPAWAPSPSFSWNRSGTCPRSGCDGRSSAPMPS